jgi:hypothetical protein
LESVSGGIVAESFGQVLEHARALLNDAERRVFTDDVLQPFAMLAYRKVIDEIATHMLSFDEAVVTVSYATASTPPTDLSTQVGYPTDMWQPLFLRERKNVGEQWIEMKRVDCVAARDPIQTLGEWEWRGNVIHTVGATEDRQVEIRYEQVPAELVAPSDALRVIGGEPILAFFTAAQAARMRGMRELAADFYVEGGDRLDTLIRRMLHSSQYTSRRPHPYGEPNR